MQKEKEEHIKKLFKDQEKLRDNGGNHFTELRVDNIKQIRGLVRYFIIIASGIIGFTLPVLGQTDLVKSNIFLVGGLAELLIVILYGFYYLMDVLEDENRRLSVQHKKYDEALDKLRDNTIILATSDWTEEDINKNIESNKKMCDQLSKDLSTKRKQDYALNIIFCTFFIALVLIVLSMLVNF